MGCEFREQIRETLPARKDAYQVDEVKRIVGTVVDPLMEAVRKMSGAIPREADGRKLKTSVEAPRPSWRGNDLPFRVRLRVEASWTLGWADIVDVEVKGTFFIRLAGTNGSVAALATDIEIRFEAHDKAMPAIHEGLSRAAERRIDSCSAVHSELKALIGKYVAQLDDATKRGVKDIRAILK